MELKDLLGGKGANLAEMTSVLKLPVPGGFTISTDACRAYLATGWPGELDAEIAKQVGAPREEDGPASRRPRRSAPRERALRRQVLDARDDGHRPQPRPQRQERQGPRRRHERRAFRVRLVPPLHLDVRAHRPRRRRGVVRAPLRGGEARRRRGERRRDPRLRAQGAVRHVQVGRQDRDRQGLPAGSDEATARCRRGGVQQLERRQGDRLPGA